MDDLILAARLRVLRRNLRNVSDVVTEVESARGELRRVVDVWSYKTPPNVLLKRIQGEIGLLDESLANDDDYRKNKINEISKGIEELRQLLTSEQIKSSVDVLSKRSGDLLDEYLREPMEEYLRKSADRYLRAIDKLEADYDRRVREAGPEERAAAGATAWAAYQSLLPSVQAVFEEYVDFLGGLALRDAGYDHGICRLADELVRGIPKVEAVSWKSLTVPARTEMLAATLARIIRLGFPEWSIWSLPLAAYGLGLGLVEDVPVFRDFIVDIGGNADPRLVVLMADALATYLLGPAYGCALILLRLEVRTDDRSGTPMAELNQLRVQTVLSTLELLGKVSESPQCLSVRTTLGAAWDSAIERARPPLDEQGPAEPAAPADDDRVAKIVDVTAEWLGGRELGGDEWTNIGRWADDLVLGRQLDPDVVNTAANRFGQLLNAAWLARLEKGENAGGTAGVDELEDLAESAGKHWTLLEGLADANVSRPSGRQPLPAVGAAGSPG